MLAVLFGAGASFDGFPTFPIGARDMSDRRMPLANELFDNRPEFEVVRERFRACLPLIPYLQNRSDGRSVEQVLEKFEVEANQGGERGNRFKRQLVALKFYLQTIISDSEAASVALAHGVTNHLTLIDLIEKNRPKDEPVLLITFNYDCLIEKALEDEVNYSFRTSEDYVRRPEYKLFKLHGSTNWGHEITLMPARTFRGRTDREMNELIRVANEIEYSRDLEIVDAIPAFNKGAVRLFPAITVPAERKTLFSCPETHINVLKSLLPKVTKLLIIGWRGAEEHFLKIAGPLLGSEGAAALKVGIVSATRESCSDPEVALARVLERDRAWEYFPDGFTKFVVTRAAESFIKS